jgi:hypothetical protein
MSAFSRVDVSSWPFDEEEKAGKSEKLWVRDPEEPNVARSRWLFKPVTEHANGTVQGGDWAEKVSSLLAEHLGIPSARVELAERDGRRGSLSQNVRPDGYELHSGHVWMSANPNIVYPGDGRVNRGRARAGYSLDNIRAALSGVEPPFEVDDDLAAAGSFGVFSSYLVLDAIIANADRHESNWAILRPVVGSDAVRLAPAFDNENSLGYQLTDENRDAILRGSRSNGVDAWVTKGMAARFDFGSGTPLSLVDLASLAVRESGLGELLELKLDSLTLSVVNDIVDRLTEMSDLERKFAASITITNSERVRNAIRNLAP